MWPQKGVETLKGSEVKYPDLLRVRVTSDLKNKLQTLALETGEDVSEIVRKFLEESLDRYYSEKSIDYLKYEFRQAVNDALKPHVERLAKISAKSAINSGTSMYMNVQMIGESGKDAVSIYTEARKKAVANLKQAEE